MHGRVPALSVCLQLSMDTGGAPPGSRPALAPLATCRTTDNRFVCMLAAIVAEYGTTTSLSRLPFHYLEGAVSISEER